MGGAEDLACGVAHSRLAPYWAPKIGGDGFLRRARTRRPARASTLRSKATQVAARYAGRVVADTFREKLRRGVRRLATR